MIQVFPCTFPPALQPGGRWLLMQLDVLSVVQNAAADLATFTIRIQVRGLIFQNMHIVSGCLHQ